MSKLEQVMPVLMVRDVVASIAFYARLGFGEAFRDNAAEPKYAGVRRDGIELHLQWHDAREWEFPNDRPTYRILVRDVDGLFAEFEARGVVKAGAGGSAFARGVCDTPFGTREFHVQDPDRNGMQFFRRR